MAWLRARLIADWMRCWKLLSIQVHVAAMLYLTVYELMPALDPNIAHLLPTPFQAPAMGVYAVLGIASRLVAQRGGNAPR